MREVLNSTGGENPVPSQEDQAGVLDSDNIPGHPSYEVHPGRRREAGEAGQIHKTLQRQRHSAKTWEEGDHTEHLRGRGIRSASAPYIACRELRSRGMQGCSALQVRQAVIHVKIEHRSGTDSLV